MHFMSTRAAAPAKVNGCVWADPHAGHAGRGGGSERAGRRGSSTSATGYEDDEEECDPPD